LVTTVAFNAMRAGATSLVGVEILGANRAPEIGD
jgi:hypothetical protein